MKLDRWPDIAAEIAKAPQLDSVCLAPTAQRTLIINGRHLTSGWNRTEEGEQQAATIPKDATEAWVYGHALGDCIAQLLLRGQRPDDERSKLERVHVVIMSRAITKVVSELDACTWTASPRVTVHLAREIDDVRRPFCISPLEVHQCDEDAEHLRARLAVILNAGFNKMNLEARRSIELGQYEKNKPLIEADGSVEKLFGTSSLPSIIVGGGPSLSSCYDWIRASADTHWVVAATTALRPLAAAGITPDIAIVVDPSKDIERHVEGLDLAALSTTTLVYIPSTYPTVVAEWKGPRVCAHVHVNHDGDLFSGGSVVHAATDLAVKMGARDVTFCGLDFCYPGERSHVDGAPQPYQVAGDSQAWRETTKNGLGEKVTTSAEMLQYKIMLADYVKLHPEVKFYKMGKQGVTVPGVEWR